MKRNRPLSPEAQNLILLMAMRPDAWTYGYDLMKRSGLKSGTLYPILMRLADKGLLQSQWEAPEQAGKPPRHAYRLTNAGLEAAQQAIGSTNLSHAAFKEGFA